jgi:hypothetical protein
MSLLVALFVSVVYAHFWRFYQGSSASFLLTLGAVPIALNLLRAGLGLAYRLERHPFEKLDLGLESDQVPPGGAFDIEVRFIARREYVLRHLVLELACTRHRTDESGRRQVESLHRHEQAIERDLEMSRGLSRSYRVSLPVEASAPFSFRTMEGKIRWALHVRCLVDDWGELGDEIELTVAPG